MCEVEWRFLRSTCDSNTSGVLIGSCQPFLSLTDFLLILFCFSYSVNMCFLFVHLKKRDTSQNKIIVMKSYMETFLCESRCHFYFHFFTTQCFAASLGCATQLTKKTTTREEYRMCSAFNQKFLVFPFLCVFEGRSLSSVSRVPSVFLHCIFLPFSLLPVLF